MKDTHRDVGITRGHVLRHAEARATPAAPD